MPWLLTGAAGVCTSTGCARAYTRPKIYQPVNDHEKRCFSCLYVYMVYEFYNSVLWPHTNCHEGATPLSPSLPMISLRLSGYAPRQSSETYSQNSSSAIRSPSTVSNSIVPFVWYIFFSPPMRGCTKVPRRFVAAGAASAPAVACISFCL